MCEGWIIAKASVNMIETVILGMMVKEAIAAEERFSCDRLRPIRIKKNARIGMKKIMN